MSSERQSRQLATPRRCGRCRRGTSLRQQPRRRLADPPSDGAYGAGYLEHLSTSHEIDNPAGGTVSLDEVALSFLRTCGSFCYRVPAPMPLVGGGSWWRWERMPSTLVGSAPTRRNALTAAAATPWIFCAAAAIQGSGRCSARLSGGIARVGSRYRRVVGATVSVDARDQPTRIRRRRSAGLTRRRQSAPAPLIALRERPGQRRWASDCHLGGPF
jgi:hypothetical protein